MSGEADSRNGVGETGRRARVCVPLNSKRPTASFSDGSWVPLSGASVDTRLIIEGKLAEMGRQPQNAQVVVEGSSPTAGLSLRDETGTFVTVESEVLTELVQD